MRPWEPRPRRPPARLTGRGGPRSRSGRSTLFAALTSSSRPTGVLCGASFSSSVSLCGLAGDREHRVGELVERLLRLGLGRLDHQRLGDVQREVDRRRMEAVVHQPLRDVERAGPVLLLEAARGEHELVHAEAVEGQVIRVLEAGEQVVGVQHGGLRHLPQLRPVRADERVRANEDAERPVEPAHPADRLRAVVVEAVGIAVTDDRRRGQVRLDPARDRDRPAAGAAAAVRLRERLVQVDVDDVEAHVARPRDPADGVQVRAVVVHERAHAVEDPGDLLDVLVEQADRGRVRDHQPGRVLVDLGPQVLDVDVAARVGPHVRQLVARPWSRSPGSSRAPCRGSRSCAAARPRRARGSTRASASGRSARPATRLRAGARPRGGR